MSRFDRRIDHTLELISGAKDTNGRFLSPVDRRVRALKQQHLPICLGGSGVHDNAGCCAAEWVSSVVGTLATVREFAPRLAEIDVLTSQLPALLLTPPYHSHASISPRPLLWAPDRGYFAT